MEVDCTAMSQHPSALLLAQLRAGEESLRIRLACGAECDGNARQATLRAAVARELGAQLSSRDRPLVRWLLEQEVAYVRAAGHGVTETFYTLIAALARFGQAEDVLLLWRAREATNETQSGIDVEQALRAGSDRVRDYLHELAQSDEPIALEARAALEWIEAGIAAGAADDLPGYFHWADERFGLQVAGPTCRFNGSASCEAALSS
ncbi:MAG TPA: hypothetical protein VGP82_21210 [Ktedonobacterales bacterium]|nr:hypothetical protein [Ktedonobacterales bacterium]